MAQAFRATAGRSMNEWVSRLACRSLNNNGVMWHLVDVKGERLGRAATHIASLLQGKHRPHTLRSNTEQKDFVVVVNTELVELTGKKWEQKLYRHHTGWPGGLKEEVASKLHERKPTELIRQAVNGMLPKNKSRPHRMTRLRLFEGSEHTYQTDKPVVRPVPEVRVSAGRATAPVPPEDVMPLQ